MYLPQEPAMPSLYFASTILHLYAAAVIAAERNEEAHLIFIDQPEGKDFPLYKLVQEWQSSPFKSVRLFHGRFPGVLNKLRKRKALFQKLEASVQEIRPQNIFVGNDRRIEFQYSMHVAETLGLKPVGHYMDEGTYTYMGRKDSEGFGDAVLDNLAKKLSYGFWWKTPPTIGGSDWIRFVHVAFPQYVHPILKQKDVIQLSAEGFKSQAIRSLSSAIISHYEYSGEALRDIQALFTLPHESLFEKHPRNIESLLKNLDKKIAEGKPTAIKYHPRNSAEDILNLEEKGAILIPAGISFEAILPLLPDNSEVWGDVSSTLLISKWLRPHIRVISVAGNNHENSALIKVLRDIGVEINT